MTDYKQLGATLGTLGTLLEKEGKRAEDVLAGWAHPLSGGPAGERGGGLGSAGVKDRRQQERAVELASEYNLALVELARASEKVLRVLAVAIPVHPASLRNELTGDLDPITDADLAAAGWCISCHRNDGQMVVIETDRHSLRYYRDYCRWCGSFQKTHGVLPPLRLLRLRHDGRRVTEADVAKALAEAKPLTKKQRRAAKKARASASPATA